MKIKKTTKIYLEQMLLYYVKGVLFSIFQWLILSQIHNIIKNVTTAAREYFRF